MSLELLILDGPQAGRRLPVRLTPAIIGRSSAADLSFPQDNFVSGRHVSLQSDEHGVLLNDLRSTNGTFLNGERITQAVARVGDIVKIGSMSLRVVEPEAAEQGSSPHPPPAWDGVSSYQQLPLPPTEPFLPAAPRSPSPMPVPQPPAPFFSLPPMEIPAPPGAFSPDAFATLVSPAVEPAPIQPATVPQAAPPAYEPSLSVQPPAVSGSTTVFSALNFSAPPPAPSQKLLAEARQKSEAVLANLRDASGSLFCLLHAGADETIPAMLALADVNLTEHCLLESEGTAAPPRWAPYLLPLTPEAPLLRLLVEKGWGKGWVSFFSSFAPFEELRGHFRKFLMVQVANGGEPYFRFYEPTVLREFLVAGNPTELAMFFGPIDEWFLEADSKAALLKARNSPDGLVTTLLPLTEGATLPQTARAF